MLALAAALVVQTGLPEKAVVQWSGIPAISAPTTHIQFHNVTLTINKTYVDVASTTLVKNDGGPGVASIAIYQSQLGGTSLPPVPVTATWAGKPLAIAGWSGSRGASAATTSAPMLNLGSYALRISYRVPIGISGFDHKQRVAAYDLTSAAPIGTLMVTYAYAPGVVFHLPDMGPNLGWQIGPKGAFVRINDYDGKAGLSSCAFYPGGFR